MGKGSRYRKVDKTRYDQNYDRIFRAAEEENKDDINQNLNNSTKKTENVKEGEKWPL